MTPCCPLARSQTDTQSRNILLDGSGTAKVGDFGLARFLPAGYLTGSSNAAAGTFAYCAPEVLLGQRSSAKADVYSLGVLLCELGGCGGAKVAFVLRSWARLSRLDLLWA